MGNADAYLEGTAGKERLKFVSPVRFRKLAVGKVVVINRFTLDSGADLANRPVQTLAGYSSLRMPVITVVFGESLARFGRLEVSVFLNGDDPAYQSFEYDVAWQNGVTFDVPFAPIAQRLLSHPAT
jgi:hypothetical protein